MIFTNRFDVVSLDNSVDDMSFSNLKYSFEGTKQTIDASIFQLVPEYRYLILEDMLFSITDYDAERTETKITAIDFVHKIGETITVDEGTYTLLDLLKRVNQNATVSLNGTEMPSIDIENGTQLTTAIDDLVNKTSAYTTITTNIDFNDVNLYNVHATVMAINPSMFDDVDDVILIDDVNTKKNFNAQLDLAKRVSFGFDSINDKSKLESWRSRLSDGNYQALIDKIDGVENAISDTEASNILASALSFNKSVFTKTAGKLYIENRLNTVDDGIPYDLGKIAFGTFNQTVSRLINFLLEEYRQVDFPTRIFMGNLHHFRIIGIDGNALYRATKVEFDVKKRQTTNLTMLLSDYFEEGDV